VSVSKTLPHNLTHVKAYDEQEQRTALPVTLVLRRAERGSRTDADLPREAGGDGNRGKEVSQVMRSVERLGTEFYRGRGATVYQGIGERSMLLFTRH
jgi:hypothetical protein